MNRRQATAAIVASPVLVGAVTLVVTVVAVVLAYGANKGIPFVPTYKISARIPGAENLVKGNEVRAGGFRVGIVQKIRSLVLPSGKAIAVIDMRLDKTVQPLATDTRVIVRPRSALGLKYVELTPGIAPTEVPPGGTIPLRNSTTPVEFDDVLNTFDAATRANSQTALQGYGDAFAGRGQSINEALQGFPAFFQHLAPVMKVLNEPNTALTNFFKQLDGAASQAAPVAHQQAQNFTFFADTFAAISRSPEALRQTIEKSPPTQDAAISSFRVQRPFLANFTDLSNRLERPSALNENSPAVPILPRNLPTINSALIVGQPVLRASPTLNHNTENLFNGLDDLVTSPDTRLGLADLQTTVRVARPLLTFVAPFQTVCNNAVYFFDGLGSHLSEGVSDGTIQRILLRSDNGGNNQGAPFGQDNRLSQTDSDRPVDVPKNEDPTTAKFTNGMPLEALHAQSNFPAIDARGNADCGNGQEGYLKGPLVTHGAYPPENFNPRDTVPDPGGGSHTVFDSNTPGLSGPTFTGVPNLQSVDRYLREGR